MAKSQKPESANANSLPIDTDTLRDFCMKVMQEGFAPAEDLKQALGPDRFTRAVAIAYRHLRLVREVRREWKNNKDVLGYEWAGQKFSKSDEKKLPPEWGFVLTLSKGIQPKYKDFLEVRLRCQWTNHILGAIPTKDNGDDLNVFEKVMDKEVLILRYNLRAMASRALPMVGKEQAIARRFGFEAIRIPIKALKIVVAQHGITGEGQQAGKGIRRSECIPAGLEFVISAMVPTSAISVSEYVAMIRMAGKRVGLSPARSAGYGDFEVLGEA